jgi:diguanylate cyclase (GGDEF)-like protein
MSRQRAEHVMDRNDAGAPEDALDPRSKGRHAREAEESTSRADQVASDADQTSSDADQTAAERDDADATSDQAASDEDQRLADLERPEDGDASANHQNASRRAREAGTLRRLASYVARATTARTRRTTAGARDVTATTRDEVARRRDAEAEAFDRASAASRGSLTEKFEELRARAADDRRSAADDRAAAARERARLEAELHAAHLDDLTGAYRRDVGMLMLQNEMDRARRADGQFVIAFVDIDGMKEVNDRDGHAAGDHVLETLVWTMRSKLRSFDPVLRYGGDEFVVGVGGVDVEEAARRFDAIEESVDQEVGVGFSIGLAELEPDETLEQLLARADARLLDAKHSPSR